jgi:Trk K+ transport system NAD-binding subunit
MHVIVAGVDTEVIGQAIESEGHDVTYVDIANRPALEEAGIHDASVFVLTEVEQATSISVAKDLTPDLKVVVYASQSIPDFARGQADLVVDPDLIDAQTVAEELDS